MDNGDGNGFVDMGVFGDSSANIGGVNNLTTASLLDTAAEFSFIADGINPVYLIFDGSGASDTEVPLNGLLLNFTPNAIPEPGTFALAALGLFGLASFFFALRRRK